MENPTERSKVKRLSDRGHYDLETAYKILDGEFLCHVGFTHHKTPAVIPTAFGRKGNTLYIHGSVLSRMLKGLAAGETELCLCVTTMNALVLARSGLHHSMNYQSVIVYGRAKELIDPQDKLEALKCITEQIIPGRWDELRDTTAGELKATSVLEIPIEEFSCKIRDHGVKDAPEDYELDTWAGLLPFKKLALAPIPDDRLASGTEVSPSVLELVRQTNKS